MRSAKLMLIIHCKIDYQMTLYTCNIFHILHGAVIFLQYCCGSKVLGPALSGQRDRLYDPLTRGRKTRILDHKAIYWSSIFLFTKLSSVFICYLLLRSTVRSRVSKGSRFGCFGMGVSDQGLTDTPTRRFNATMRTVQVFYFGFMYIIVAL